MVKSERKGHFSNVLVEPGVKPTDVTSDYIDMLESLLLQLHGSRYDTIDAAWLYKFKTSTDNDLRLSPPSKEALSQHIYCASYQAGYLLKQSIEELDISEPQQWSWKTDSKVNFQELWTTSQSSVTVKNFIETCSCKTGKCRQCKLARVNFACFSMCGCVRGWIWTLYYSHFKFLLVNLKDDATSYETLFEKYKHYPKIAILAKNRNFKPLAVFKVMYFIINNILSCVF